MYAVKLMSKILEELFKQSNLLDEEILTDSIAYVGTMKITPTIHFCSW